jgi:hypothetical protein
MTDIISTIMHDIEGDPTLDSKKIIVELESKGFLRKRKTIHLKGSVNSETMKTKVKQVADHFAGDNFSVVNELLVSSD